MSAPPLGLATLGAGAAGGLGIAIPGGGGFRRVLSFSLATGGGAAGMVLNPGTRLDIRWTAREVPALGPSAPEPGTLAVGAGGLRLTLPRARMIARIVLSGPAGDAVALFRADGSAVAEDAVAVAASGAALGGVAGGLFVLRRRRAGTDLPLTAGDVTAVLLAAHPLRPRVALRVAPGDPFAALPPAIDAAGTPVFPAIGAWGDRLASALAEGVARLGDGGILPAQIALELALEDDAPSAAEVTAFALDWRLSALIAPNGSQNGAPNGVGADKAVLRFPGRRAVGFTLPAGARPETAALRLSWRPQGGTSGQGSASAAGAEAPAPGMLGLGLDPGEAVALRVDLAVPEAVAGLAAPLAAIVAGTALRLVLWDDLRGAPGPVRAESEVLTLVPGPAAMVAARFPAPAFCPAGPVWAGLRLTSGRAVLSTPAAQGIAARSAGGAWSLLAPGPVPAVTRLAPAVPGVADGGRTALHLSVGGTAVALADRDGDLGAELAPHLAAPSGAAPAEIAIETDGRGIATVYALALTYSLAPP